jgi:arylsulfatase A-like enzyme
MTLKIDKYAHRNTTTIRLSGRMQAERFEHIGTAVAKRLAADGASVDNTYASSALCTPARHGEVSSENGSARQTYEYQDCGCLDANGRRRKTPTLHQFCYVP